MARVCTICKKEYHKANHVATGIGKRVSGRTIRSQKPNLRSKRLSFGTTSVKVKMCASCLKRLKFELKKSSLEENPQS